MSQPMLPRESVHEWSDAIADHPDKHQAAIARLLRDQRRITRFVEQNASNMSGTAPSVAIYLIGVVARMFEIAGGQLRAATWDDVRAAEKSVNASAASLLPLDAGFLKRARAIQRSQPHVLDEALYALFVRKHDDEEQTLDNVESFKVYLMMWVATEVLSKNWKPPASFEGSTDYRHAPVDDEEKAA